MSEGCRHFQAYIKEEGFDAFRVIDAVYASCINQEARENKALTCCCFECGSFGIQLYACLHCVFFGCRGPHINTHLRSKKHPVAFNLSHNTLYCYSCRDFIYDENCREISALNRRLEAKDLQKGLSWQPWIPTPRETSLMLANPRRRFVRANETIGLRGLINLGSTCFMNCIVQTIVHTPLLSDYFLSERHECSNKTSLKCLVCEVSRLFQEFYSGTRTPLSLHRLLHLIWNHAKHLAGYEQQDAHEFFIAFIDVLNRHCHDAKNEMNDSQQQSPNTEGEPPAILATSPTHSPPPSPDANIFSDANASGGSAGSGGSGGSDGNNATANSSGTLGSGSVGGGGGGVVSGVGASAGSLGSGSNNNSSVPSASNSNGGSNSGKANSDGNGNNNGNGNSNSSSASALTISTVATVGSSSSSSDSPNSNVSCSLSNHTTSSHSSNHSNSSNNSNSNGNGNGSNPSFPVQAPTPLPDPAPMQLPMPSTAHCIIDQIFTGMLQSDVVCQACKNVSTTLDPFFDISLDLGETHVGSDSNSSGSNSSNSSCSSGSRGNGSGGGTSGNNGNGGSSPKTLIDCLERYTRAEHLGSSAKIECSACNSYQESTKQLSLRTLPSVVSFHLKRFEHKSLIDRKISAFIEFPLEFDMTPFMSDKSNAFGDFRYSLYAVVNHVGTIDSGHYTAFIRHQKDTWVKCDDHIITQATVKQVLESEGYLLFYHKNILEYE